MPGIANTPMSLEEYVDMFAKAELLDENFGYREIGPLFNMSMMTQKNEIESDRHLNMTFVEFIECLARCADKFDLQFLEDHFP